MAHVNDGSNPSVVVVGTRVVTVDTRVVTVVTVGGSATTPDAPEPDEAEPDAPEPELGVPDVDPDVEPDVEPDEPDESNVHTSCKSAQQLPLIEQVSSQWQATISVPG